MIVDEESVFAGMIDEGGEVVLFGVVPLVFRFGFEDLLKFRDGGFFVLERRSLEFARVAESSPTRRQQVQVLASLVDNLSERKMLEKFSFGTAWRNAE